MGALRLAGLAVLVVVFVSSTAPAQPVDPDTVGKVVGPYLDQAVGLVLPPSENESAQDLHSEDIRVAVVLDVVSIDYQVVGILFGGGKIAADAVCDLRLEFRGVSAERLDAAIQSGTGDVNASLQSMFGVPSDRLALTAEEVRVLGAGALLAYFQAYEARKAQTFLQETLPGLTILDMALEWSNTLPASYVTGAEPPGVPAFDPTQPLSLASTFGVPPLREPPLVLDAQARLNYLTRISLAEMLKPEGNATAEQEKEAERDLKRRLQEEQGDRFVDRSAFNLLGFGQVLNVSVPPGWRVDVGVNVPKGYTVEGATDELVVAGDSRGAALALDGLARTEAANPVALATLSNRFLVTTVVLGAVLLFGFALRLPLEAGVLALHQKVARRRQRREEAARRTAAALQSRARLQSRAKP